MVGDIPDFLRNAAFGALAGVVLDAATEISAAPVLNDPAPVINNPQTSMVEAILYTFSALAIVGGGYETFTGHKVFGFGKELLGTGVGTLVGTYTYERDLSDKLGIRRAAAGAPEGPPG